MIASPIVAAMFGIARTTFACGRADSSLLIDIAAISEITILLEVALEISDNTCFASPALTETKIMSACSAAFLFSAESSTLGF